MGNAKSALQQTVANFIFNVQRENLEFVRIVPTSFELDLILIESSLPQMLTAMVIKAHKHGVSKFSELLYWLEISNPLEFDQSLGHNFYEYKLKNFLMSFSGVMPRFDYKLQANHLLENAALILSNVTFTANNSELLITIEIKIDFD